MLIINEQIALVSVPKSGSNSVREMFKRGGISSFRPTGKGIHDVTGDEGKKVVTSVRNPFDWIISVFKYLKTHETAPGLEPLNHLQTESFNKFFFEICHCNLYLKVWFPYLEIANQFLFVDQSFPIHTNKSRDKTNYECTPYMRECLNTQLESIYKKIPLARNESC